MKSIEEGLLQQLNKREKEGNLRSLKTSSGKLDFCSNDYLGLAKSKGLYQLIRNNLNNYPPLNGSTGSRLLAGNSLEAEELEAFLSNIFLSEKALFFNAGFTANLSILSCVPQKGDSIFYDQLIHASLREGGRLSFANHYSFRHNDLNDLGKKLSKAIGEKFIVAESVYSMDGDFCDLKGLINLCEKYNAHLILDEAHSTGVWGENGNGIACNENLHNKIFARIYTFGKAMGVHGACVAGSKTLINYLINFARPFIYTTAPPLHSLIAVKSAFEYLSQHNYLQTELVQRINYFKKIISDNFVQLQENLIESQGPIQIITIGGNEKTKNISQQLQNEGFDIRAVLSPTVKRSAERLRICLHSFNSDKEIENMLAAMQKYLHEAS